jgi:hypothetical protein
VQKAVRSEDERRALMGKVAQFDEQLVAIKADAVGAENAVAKVLKELDLVGGEPMRQQRNLVDSLISVCFNAMQMIYHDLAYLHTSSQFLLFSSFCICFC